MEYLYKKTSITMKGKSNLHDKKIYEEESIKISNDKYEINRHVNKYLFLDDDDTIPLNDAIPIPAVETKSVVVATPIQNIDDGNDFTTVNYIRKRMPIKRLTKLTNNVQHDTSTFIEQQSKDWDQFIIDHNITSDKVENIEVKHIPIINIEPNLQSAQPIILQPTVLPALKPPSPKIRLQSRLLCSSIMKKTQCLNGNNCGYAHSMDELAPENCRFNPCRRFDQCKFIHNKETIQSYWNRLTK